MWGYHKVKHQLWDVRDELDRLERKIDLATGAAAPAAIASVNEAAAPVEASQEQKKRGGRRWEWGHPHEARQWEKSWSWGSGPADSRV